MMIRGLPRTILLLGLLVSVSSSDSWTQERDHNGDQVTASGSVAWVSDPDLDLIGALEVDLPFRLGADTSWFFGVDTDTVIQKSIGDFTFLVRELNYAVELGARHVLGSRRRLSLFLGQQGKEVVDADGQPFIRYVGARLESAVPLGEAHTWGVSAGGTFQEREVSADGFVRGDLHLAYPWRNMALSFGFDFEVDALIGDSSLHADVRAGPHLLLGGPEAPRLLIFVHYLRARHPLGVDLSSVLFGFSYRKEPGASGGRLAPPHIGGLVAAGGGEGRETGRLRLDLATPPLGAAGWLSADFDANILTGRDTGELYYFYHLGYEHPLSRGIAGVYFYHRSNHQLAEPNDRITSINVLEAGFESPGWHGESSERGRMGGLDFLGRAGFLLSSSFGENRRWHAVGGIRWLLPWSFRGIGPVIHLEAEEGDVGRRSYALGVATPGGLGLQIEYRRDDQFFGRDRTALLLTGEKRF